MKSKKIFYSILAFTISIGLFNSCSYIENQLSSKSYKSVELIGVSNINVRPDTDILELGIEMLGENTNDIQLKNNRIMDNIVDNIVKLGIDKKDIDTTSYELHPSYGFNSKNIYEFLGYTLSTTISIKVKDINKIVEIFTEATKAGANSYDIKFTVNDYDKYYKEALKKAIEDGNNKAKEMSKKLGVDLGSAVKIDEDQNYINYNENNNFINANYEKDSNIVRGADQLITAAVKMTFQY